MMCPHTPYLALLPAQQILTPIHTTSYLPGGPDYLLEVLHQYLCRFYTKFESQHIIQNAIYQSNEA